jgi:hypothetical protein
MFGPFFWHAIAVGNRWRYQIMAIMYAMPLLSMHGL